MKQTTRRVEPDAALLRSSQLNRATDLRRNFELAPVTPLGPVKMAPRRLPTRRPRRVLVHGLAYFARIFSELMNGDGWEFRYYADSGFSNLVSMAQHLRSCDIAYQIGGRVTIGKFLRMAKTLGKRNIVMHWVGSDVLDERKFVSQGKSSPWVLGNIQHWVDSTWLAQEVRALGLTCELVPLPSPLVPERPSALPPDFSVLVYTPDVNCGHLYGLDRIVQVAGELPHIQFVLVGLRSGLLFQRPPNLAIYGRLPNLAEFYRRASVLWRPVRHDGLSFMVLEALGHGRHVLWSYDFPGCVRVEDAATARSEIARLHALHKEKRLQINTAGVRAIAEGGYLPQTLRSRIHSRLDEILESCP